MAAQHRPLAAPGVEQPAAQGALKQVQPEQRLPIGRTTRAGSLAAPARLDLPRPVEHHFVVLAVRAAMQRQADAFGLLLQRRQQQAVAAEIVKSDAARAQRADHLFERAMVQDLQRQQMVPLQPLDVPRPIAPVDAAKRQSGAGRTAQRHCAAIMPSAPGANHTDPAPTSTISRAVSTRPCATSQSVSRKATFAFLAGSEFRSAARRNS